MSSWKGELTISVLGFAGVSLGKFELKKLGERQIKTVNVCPKCQTVPERVKHDVEYRCPKCGAEFKGWYQLQRAYKAGEKLIPLPPRKTTKTEKASLKLLDLAEVRGLITRSEYAIIPAGEQEKKNLQKLGNMLRKFNKVALFKVCFRKGAEEHLMYVTVADDGMIMVREIIPLNLVEPLPYGVVFCSDEVDEKEVEELMNAMPKATEEDLCIKDEVIEALAQAPETEDLAKAIKKVMIQNPK